MSTLSRYLIAPVLAVGLAACATTPDGGRSQMLLMSDTELNRMGEQAFAQLRQEKPRGGTAAQRRQVACITDALVARLDPQWRELPWEFEVFTDPTPNAFALPGGKIGVHTGMFDVAADQHQMAAVIGHEIGHVIFRHANERISRAQLVGVGAALGGAVVGARTGTDGAGAAELLNVVGQGALVLPFSREQEREADVYGQRLMADAGFDPAAAPRVWQNMIAASGGAGAPAFLSTHPDPGARARTLEQRAPELQAAMRQAHQAGRRPACG